MSFYSKFVICLVALGLLAIAAQLVVEPNSLLPLVIGLVLVAAGGLLLCLRMVIGY